MEIKTAILSTVIAGTLFLTLSYIPSNVELSREGWQNHIGRKHTSSSKVDINQFLIGVIENFRDDMVTGIPELKVPILDPFTAEKPFYVDVKNDKATVQGNFTDVQVLGIAGFVVETLNADLKNLSLTFHLRIPWVKGAGNYSVNGKIVKIIPIRGNGEFWVESLNLTVKAHATLETSNDNHLQLSKDFDVMIGFDKVELYLENFLGGGRWTEVLLKILNDISKDIFQKCIPIIKKELNESLLKVINNQLNKLPITSIIPGQNADDYIDQILENLQNYVKEKQLDPMALPDHISEFSQKVLYVNITGTAKLYDGWLWGFSTLHRTDTCDLNITRTNISLSAHLGINDLKLTYRGATKFMKLGPSLVIGGKINKVEFYFKMHQSNKKGAKPILEELEIVEMSTIWIQMSGLGPLTWLLKYLLTLITKLVEYFLVHKLKRKIQEYMEAEFLKLSFPV